MDATTIAMLSLGLGVEGIALSASARRWEGRRPAFWIVVFIVAFAPTVCFALTARGLNERLTGEAGFLGTDWLRFGITLSVVWALALALTAARRRSTIERVVPLVFAGLLFTFGVTQVYAWEVADTNAYVTSTALPELRAAGIDAPSELQYEAETGQPAIVTNEEWLAIYNAAALENDGIRVVDPSDATRRQLFAVAVGLMAAAVVFTVSSRVTAGDSDRRTVHLAFAGVFGLVVITAVPGSIGTTLPAVVTVAGLSLTMFELTKLAAIISFALALRATSEGASWGRIALGVVVLATGALALTDLGAGLTVGAIGLVMSTLVMQSRRARVGLIVTIAAIPVLAPMAAGAIGDSLPGAATARIEDWTQPWESHDEATVSNLARMASQDIEAAVEIRANGVEWQRAIDLIEQELAFRVWAVNGRPGDTPAPPVIPVDRTDELLLAEAEQAWGELGGYQATTPQERSRVSNRLDTFLTDLRGLEQRNLGLRQDGFQLQRSLFALRAGGVLGVGLGQGRPEAIPTVTEDLALVAWGESAGLIGIITVSGTVLALTAVALRRVDRAKTFAGLLLVGLGSQYAIQAIVNAGGIIGALPFTGIPFPFISRSGTSAVGAGIAIGLLMAVMDRQLTKQGPLTDDTASQRLGLGVALGVVGASFALLMTTGSRLLTPGPLFGSLDDIERRHLTVPDQWANADYRIASGAITDRNGTPLVFTPELGSSRRVAGDEIGQAASHLIRRLDATYGEVLGERDSDTSMGATLVTTLDTDLQMAANAAFDAGTREILGASDGELRGAVVLLDATTGDILAMVSRPTFSPAELVDVSVWAVAEGSDRREGFDSRFLNRAFDGLYPPASTFKTVTAAAALDAGLHQVGDEDFDYTTGPSAPREPSLGHPFPWQQLIIPDGPPVTSDHPGLEDWSFDIAEAFAHSNNIAFAEMGIELGPQGLVDAGRSVGYETPIVVDGLGTTTSTLDTAPDAPTDERPLAQTIDLLTRTSFGQGEVLASPLHVAMVAAAVANDGVIMQPRLVEGLQRVDGTWLTRSEPNVFIDTGWADSTVEDLDFLFRSAVEYGTAINAAVPDGGTVGAKTGTAEWSDGANPHSWIMATYPAEQPRLALAVIVEEAGAGGEAAARIASALFGSAEVAEYLAGLEGS